MEYYFPGILTRVKIDKQISGKIPYTFDSASSALRFTLRYLGLKKGERVAIPAFACDSVENAVVQEGLVVTKLDLKNDETFWTNYNVEFIGKQNVKAVILVHLYGFLHPDTLEIMEFCKKINVPVIHDLAQCYGVNKKELPREGIFIYSFGPGKSSIAALGGFIEGINDEVFYKQQTRDISGISLGGFVFTSKAKIFVKSRVYRYKFSLFEELWNKVIHNFHFYFFYGRNIYTMTRYQQKAASYIMGQIDQIKIERLNRHRYIEEAVEVSKNLSMAYMKEEGNYFKAIVYCYKDRKKFAEYLIGNEVPYFRLFDESCALFINNQLSNFNTCACGFFELSTEASLPLEEIRRVALILKQYK